MTTYAGEVRIKTRLDAAGINSGLSKVTAMMGKLAVVVGVAFSAQAIINFSKAAVEAASKSETAWAGLGFVLDANNRSITEAKGFLQDYTSDGLVPLTDAIKAYQNMVMRGYDTAQIEDMLRIMKDSAAFGRQGQFSMGEAIEKATQGLRMENSLLTDSVGIQTNVARMWDEYARSIGTTTNALTLAQKRQAEYNGFMKEGGIFAGAAAKYANTYAGRVSQLGTAFYNLRVAVGNAIIPVLNQIIPVITKVINWFTRLFNIVGRVMNLLFGTNVSMNDTAQGAQDAADATDDMADNLEEANKAAKGSLAAFDKLNVLAQTEEGGGAPGGGGVGGGMPMPVPDTEPTIGALDEMEERIQEFITRIKELFSGNSSEIAQKLSAGIIDGLTKAREAVQGFDFKGFGAGVGNGLNTIVSSIQSFLTNIDFKTIGTQFGGLMSDVFKGGLDTAIGFLQTVDWSNVGTTVWTAILGVIDFVKGYLTGYDWGGVVSRVFELLGSAFGAAASFIAGLATAIWESLKSAWAGVKEYFDGFKDEAGGDIWQGIADGIDAALTNIYAWIKEHIINPFIDGFKKAFGIASPSTVMAEQGGYIIDGMKKGIEDAWNNAKKWFTDKIIAPLKEWFTEAWEDIKKFASDAWTKIEEVWTTVSTWFKDNVTEPVKTFFSDVWEDIKGFFTGAWDDIKLTWKTVSTWFYDNVTEPVKTFFSDTWEDISTKVTGVWEDIKTAWNEAATWFNDTIWQPIKDKAGEVWDSIKIGAVNIGTDIANGVISAVNGVIGFINSMIDGLENAINGLIDLANRLPLINIPNIDLPNIKLLDEIPRQRLKLPALATGAVIPANAPFAAILGDQKHGTNIETPERLLRDLIREELGRNQSRQDTIHNVIKLDGQVLYEAVKKIDRRVGTSLISGSGIR